MNYRVSRGRSASLHRIARAEGCSPRELVDVAIDALIDAHEPAKARPINDATSRARDGQSPRADASRDDELEVVWNGSVR